MKKTIQKKALLLVSHGSYSRKTKEEVTRLLRILKKRSRIKIFTYAFLEIESPCILKGIDICVKKGATHIMLLLNFLNSGQHVDYDIPRIVNKARQKYPHVSFHITKPLGQHRKIFSLFLDMIKNDAPADSPI